MSQLKKVVSGLTFDKNKNKKLPKIHKRFKRKNLLKQGYKEMASLNLTLAQMCFEADSDITLVISKNNAYEKDSPNGRDVADNAHIGILR